MRRSRTWIELVLPTVYGEHILNQYFKMEMPLSSAKGYGNLHAFFFENLVIQVQQNTLRPKAYQFQIICRDGLATKNSVVVKFHFSFFVFSKFHMFSLFMCKRWNSRVNIILMWKNDIYTARSSELGKMHVLITTGLSLNVALWGYHYR